MKMSLSPIITADAQLISMIIRILPQQMIEEMLEFFDICTESVYLEGVLRVLLNMAKDPGFIRNIFLLMLSEERKQLSIDLLQNMTTLFPEEDRELLQRCVQEIINYFDRDRIDDMLSEIALPRVLSFSFGTEECVRLRRELVFLSDSIWNTIESNSFCNRLSSGSISEGIAYPSSDHDVMLILKNVIVVDSLEVVEENLNLEMVTSELSPAYCLLFDLEGSFPDNLITIINEQRCVSSSLIKEFNKTDSFFGTDVTIHGPSINVLSAHVERDLVLCIRCPFWPHVAREWILRERTYEWPSQEQIQHVIGNGCHVVPIGDPDSPTYEHEWRISFSLAERYLVHSFNHSQFLTYNVLRNALKNVIDQHFPDVLCTYFIKTTIFHTIERTHRKMWNTDNLNICYIVCLSVLYLFISNAYCPNYFIPRYNMMKRKINNKNRDPLLRLIRHLIQIRILGFDFIKYFDVKPFKHIEFNHDVQFFTSVILDQTMFSIRQLIWTSSNSISNLSETSTENKFIQVILNEADNYNSLKLMNVLGRKEKRNKQLYFKHKILKRYFRIPDRGYLTTSKLTEATYLYLVGKPKATISVLEANLPRFKQCLVLSNVESEAYMNKMGSMGYYTLEERASCACGRYKIYSNDLHAFPSSLFIWLISFQKLELHPLTYAFFLENLSCVLSKNTISLVKSTTKMMEHIDSLTNEIDILNAYMCMSIIKFAQLDNYGAYIWFNSVYGILKNVHKNMKIKISKVYELLILKHQKQKAICENKQTKTKSQKQSESEQRMFDDFKDHFSNAVLVYVACLIHREIYPNPNVQKIISPVLDIDLD